MNMKELSEKANKILKIKGGEPVGIKFIKQETKETSQVKKLEEPRALCQMLKMAAIYEKTRFISFENIDACVVGTYILGLGTPPENLKQRWIDGFLYTSERFDQLCKNIEAIPQKKYAGAIIGPLKEFNNLACKESCKPDAVILFVNSSQAYMLYVGYFDATGKKPVSSINGHAACEVISAVELGKSPWLTIPCGGARSVADSQDDEIWIGMTTEELELSLNRLESIGFKYPPAVNQMSFSSLNPKHPLTGLIKR